MTTLTHEPHFRTEPTAHQEGVGNHEQRPSRVNVGEKERNVSLAAGAIVALQGLSHMSLAGLFEAAVGGCLIYRGPPARVQSTAVWAWTRITSTAVPRLTKSLKRASMSSTGC